MSIGEDAESLFERRHLTLDLAGLTTEQRDEASTLLGGSAAEYVTLDEEFLQSQVKTIVFKWGDILAKNTFTQMFEHLDDSYTMSLPFTPVAVVGDTVWQLVLQDSGWHPDLAYEHDEDYKIIPFDIDEGLKQLTEYVATIPTTVQALGLLVDRYVLFALATDLGVYNSPVVDQSLDDSTPEQISGDELIKQIGQLVDSWDFSAHIDRVNNQFSLQVTHLLLETFGQEYKNGGWILYPGGDISGERIPRDLHHLITTVWKDEPFLQNENTIKLESAHDYIEDDPIIPRWDEIKDLPFAQQLAFMIEHSDVRDNVVATRVAAWPQVQLTFEPASYANWGIDFMISERGISLYPFGRSASTKSATDFVIESQSKSQEISELACRLALLAAEFSTRPVDDSYTSETLKLLTSRLSGNDLIPLHVKDFHFRPGNSIKNLLIQELKKVLDQ